MGSSCFKYSSLCGQQLNVTHRLTVVSESVAMFCEHAYFTLYFVKFGVSVKASVSVL